MAITTKTRKDLKSYFVKNAIPTEGNFADLIDAQLNQSDDGVFKLAGEPLSVVAAGGDLKRVLRLYSNYPSANPDWLISLNPAEKSGGTSYRAGFGITDAPGNIRLFIDATTGNLGVGTNNPQAKLDVNGAARVSGDLEATGAAKLGSLRVTGAITPSAGNAETAGIMFPADPFGGGGDRAWIRYHNARGGEKGTLEIGLGNDGDDHILLSPSGNVGIGVTDPQSKLDVAGNARVSGNMEVTGTVKANRITGQNTLVLNDYQTVNPASNVFIHSQPTDRDAWIFLDSGGTTSNWGIYHRQIDTAVAGLPANSIGFIGGGTSKLQAYISLQDGSAGFAGNLNAAGNLSVTGFTTARGVAVNDAQNTGVGRGLWLWSTGDSNHVIYSANPQGKSPADKAPPAGFFNASHRMRFRTASGQGFLFENNAETALVDIASDTGNLWTKGAIHAGNSDIYFTQTDHNHTGIGNTTGYAAIENANNYGALMILGRQTASGRIVKLWDYLEVNGNLTVTGAVLKVGDWSIESGGDHLYIKRGTATVARFSIGNDRFNVFRDVNGVGPYFYYNRQGNTSTGGSGAPP